MVERKLSTTSTLEIPLSKNGVYNVQLDSLKGTWTRKAVIGMMYVDLLIIKILDKRVVTEPCLYSFFYTCF
jgi:hypothetical protein